MFSHCKCLISSPDGLNPQRQVSRSCQGFRVDELKAAGGQMGSPASEFDKGSINATCCTVWRLSCFNDRSSSEILELRVGEDLPPKRAQRFLPVSVFTGKIFGHKSNKHKLRMGLWETCPMDLKTWLYVNTRAAKVCSPSSSHTVWALPSPVRNFMNVNY